MPGVAQRVTNTLCDPCPYIWVTDPAYIGVSVFPWKGDLGNFTDTIATPWRQAWSNLERLVVKTCLYYTCRLRTAWPDQVQVGVRILQTDIKLEVWSGQIWTCRLAASLLLCIEGWVAHPRANYWLKAVSNVKPLGCSRCTGYTVCKKAEKID